MSSITLSGLSTGIDTESIVQKLVEVEKRRLNLLTQTLTKYSDKKTALSELESKVSTFKTALNNLSSLNKLKAFNTTSSDSDIVTASASPAATEGSHSVQIKQLATAERIVHDGTGFSSASSLVGAGTFIYSYNYQEVVLTTDANTTLQELVNKINNDANNPGVTASLLEYDDGNGRWHLVVAGKETGDENQITINSSNTELKTAQTKFTLKSGGANATKTTRLKDLATFYDSTTITLTKSVENGGTAPATNHSGGDVNMTFNINSYSTVQDLMDAIETAYGNTVHVSLDEGFLKVTDAVTGASLTDLGLSFTGGSVSQRLEFTSTVSGGSQSASLAGFTAASFTETQSAQNALVKVDGYPQDVYNEEDPPELIQENWISRQSNSISDLINGVTLNLQATTKNASGEYDSVSISLNRDTETLKENLNAMISAYNAIVTYIKEKTTYDAENKKMGILSDNYSVSSISSLITSPLRSTAGGFTSSDAFTTPQDIGLTIDADGTLELDTQTFDEAISLDYNAVLNLIGAQQVGSTFGGDSSYISFYGASQYTNAGSYDVEVVKDDEGTISALVKLTTENWSQARRMTVDGNTLYANNARTSAGDPLYPEYGMVLTLDPNIGNGMFNTTVNVRQGFGDKLYDMVTDMLKSSGRITLAKKSISTQITDQQDRIDDEITRLEKYEQRLKLKYARMETLLNNIQQQMSSMNAML